MSPTTKRIVSELQVEKLRIESVIATLEPLLADSHDAPTESGHGKFPPARAGK